MENIKVNIKRPMREGVAEAGNCAQETIFLSYYFSNYNFYIVH